MLTLLFYTQCLQSKKWLSSPLTSTSGKTQHVWLGRERVCARGSLTLMLWLVSSVEITMDSNSEGSEGNLSPNKEDVYYGSVAQRRIWRSVSSEDQYGMWCGFLSRRLLTLTRPEWAEFFFNTCAVVSLLLDSEHLLTSLEPSVNLKDKNVHFFLLLENEKHFPPLSH